MKVLSEIKKGAARHYVLAAAEAAVLTAIAAKMQPLDLMTMSAGRWAAALSAPFLTLFLFLALSSFSIVRRPKLTVFRSVKYFCRIGVPFVLLMTVGLFFDPTKAELYSQSFFGSFLPKWAALWVICTAAAFALLKAVGKLIHRGLEKGSRPARAARGLAVMFTPQKTVSRKPRQGKGRWFAAAGCILMTGLGVFIGIVAVYLHNVYSNMEFEAILFTVTFAAGGLAVEDIIAAVIMTAVFLLITGYFGYHLIRCFANDSLTAADGDGEYTLVLNGRKRAVCTVLSAVLMLTGIAMFAGQTHFIHYAEMKLGRSDIYENYYITPTESSISFPESKRNLIYIYLESMESTYASKDAGGALGKNYISELTALAGEDGCVSFSNTDKLGGASVYVPSITFTQGSTVAQTSGISLNTQIFPENGRIEYPSMIRLEDILHDNGYEQLYIEGSKGEFSMYDKYVGRYDDCTLFDRTTAADQGYTDESEDYIWKWGIEDRKLIDITKELITDISKKDKPFFVTMYTMDTHTFECGHRCPNCDDSISSDYLAAIDCASRQVYELVNWIRQQPFYENTTVILVGDHLGNEKTTLVDIEEGYIRTTYNCIINPAKQAANSKGRLFSSVDMFPTTLSAIGAEIKGDRLGLGTDLFSQTPTLCEELGEEEYKAQLEKSSDYYSRVFCGAED